MRPAGRFRKGFFHLKRFYLTFYKCYFEIDIKDSEIQKFVENQLEIDIHEIRKIHFPSVDKLNKQKVLDYTNLVREYVFMKKNPEEAYKRFRNIMDCLDYSYSIEFGITSSEAKFLCQELVYPTEVIAMVLEITGITPKIKRAILSID